MIIHIHFNSYNALLRIGAIRSRMPHIRNQRDLEKLING